MWLHWHRRDLRGTDNRGLVAADDTLLPVFVIDPNVLAYGAPPRVAFLLDALESLRNWYRDRESDLVVREGQPADVIPTLADEYDASGITWNHDYSGLAQQRDERITETLDETGLVYEIRHDAVHHEPGTIRTNNGEPYSVFSYFWKKWADREKNEPVSASRSEDLAAVDAKPLPDLAALGFDEPPAELPNAGMEAARDRLETFCDDAIYRYEDERDHPARGSISGLSQDLKYGTIGVREVYARTEAAMDDADDESERDSVEAYQRQLAWREFYTQVLYFNPNVITENYKTYEHEIQWRNDEEELQAWKDGETGYPIVDHGKRREQAIEMFETARGEE